MIKEGHNIEINTNHAIRPATIASGILLATTIFASAICMNTTITFADSAIASVNVSAACVMTATDVAHSSDIIPNQWTGDIGQSNLTAVCNDPGGYAIYAIGYTNNEYGNTNLINTIDSTKTIVTGPNKSGNTSNWSMKLGKGTGESATIEGETTGDTEDFYTDYHIIPSTYTKVAKKTDATSSTTAGTSLTTTYGVFTTTTQIAGTYEGQVKYTLVHPSTAPEPWYPQPVACSSGKVCFNPNAPATAISGSMDDRSVYDANTTIELLASNFKHDGYGFAGWTDKFDWVLNQNDQNGNGTGPNAGYHIYGPNETISITPGQYSGDNPGLSLYAVWVPSAGNLQGWTGCSNLGTGQVTALTDTRDNQVYAVAKLKDNKCWMIENLRLDNQYTTSAENIAKAQGYNSSFIGLANPETANFTQSTTANSLYSIDGSTSAPAITGDWQGYRLPRYNNQNTSFSISDGTTLKNIYSYGNYYTWAAAIADTSYYDTNNQSITATSICPSGWRLPSGGNSDNADNSDFWQLGIGIMGFAPENSQNYEKTEINSDNQNANQAYRAYPNNFIFSGNYEYNGFSNLGTRSIYWSSTVRYSVGSYSLFLRSSGSEDTLYPGNDVSGKSGGRTIRCVK